MKAKITVNREKVQGEVSPLLFGHFMEHAFGNIYGGVYDPGHPSPMRMAFAQTCWSC